MRPIMSMQRDGEPVESATNAVETLLAAGADVEADVLRERRQETVKIREIEGDARGYRTILALGAQVSLWDRLILKWMPRMREKAPDIALRVEADYSISLMRQLSDGLLDIGVMYTPLSSGGPPSNSSTAYRVH